MDKDIKKKRRAFDVEEGLPVGGTGPGKGRGRRKKKAEGEGEGDALVDLARDDKFSKNPNRKRRHTEVGEIAIRHGSIHTNLAIRSGAGYLG